MKKVLQRISVYLAIVAAIIGGILYSDYYEAEESRKKANGFREIFDAAANTKEYQSIYGCVTHHFLGAFGEYYIKSKQGRGALDKHELTDSELMAGLIWHYKYFLKASKIEILNEIDRSDYVVAVMKCWDAFDSIKDR